MIKRHNEKKNILHNIFNHNETSMYEAVFHMNFKEEIPIVALNFPEDCIMAQTPFFLFLHI